MFNEDQEGWMKFLATLPAEAKCDCGWDRRGECCGACYGFPEKGGRPCEHDWAPLLTVVGDGHKCRKCGKTEAY